MQLAKYKSPEERVQISKVIENDNGTAYWTATKEWNLFSSDYCVVLNIEIIKIEDLQYKDHSIKAIDCSLTKHSICYHENTVSSINVEINDYDCDDCNDFDL